MAADLPARDAASAVATVLAVTPTDPDDGTVITHWRHVVDTSVPDDPDEYDSPVWGHPEPIAARQAAAVLRWAADKLAAESEAHHAATGEYLFPLADWRVRGFATEIEDLHPEEGR